MFRNRGFKRSRRAGVWLAFGFGSMAAAANGLPITYAEEVFPQLRDLMQLSINQSSNLVVPALNIEQREQEAAIARGENLPQARLFARAVGSYQMREDIDDEFKGDVQANFTITQNLYHWGSFSRREAVARKRVDAETVQYAETSGRHFLNLRTTYLNWLLMGEQIDILERSIELNQGFVSARRQLVEVGESSEQDVLEMEARLLENREALAWITSRKASLEATLRQLVGPGLRVADLERPSLEAIAPVSDAEFEQLQRAVLGRRDRIESFHGERLGIYEEIEDDQLFILSKRTWPMIQFVTGAFSDQIDGINQSDSVWRMQYFAGIQVQWNLFDGWQTDSMKLAALARKRSIALQAELANDQARSVAEDLLAQLNLNRKQIEARSLREQLLGRRVELLREQAERNLVTGSERIEGEINYLDIARRLREARVNYLINSMELGYLLRDDPTLNYPLPPL